MGQGIARHPLVFGILVDLLLGTGQIGISMRRLASLQGDATDRD